MQENLQNFNYEVFVSKTMLDMLLYSDDPWDSSFYQLIILSESLSNRELKRIVPKLKERNAVIFRKYVCEPINKEKGVLE
ncbi:MAG: helix-turn-helix domain-containing protein, partial [Enterococcus hulanensis]